LLYGRGLGVVKRQQRGLLIRDFGKVFFEHCSDASVKLAPPAPKERFVGGILKKGMLEEIDSARRRATRKEQPRLHKRLQRFLQPLLGKPITNLRDYFI
jgi:hypothetical protein